MKLEFEYGNGMMSANLPDNTDVFIPGETVKDPDYIPEDKLEEAYLKSLHNPEGNIKPISEIANQNSKVTIIFPDIVKGGLQETSHRKLSIKLILEELKNAGVKKENILLICSNGLHPKNTREEIYSILGKEIFDEFWYTNQIINHDSEDYDHMVYLGKTKEHGDDVWLNKYVYDSDLAILIGHSQGNPYGGYSGGYKHCSTGLNHWTSIASHHVPQVMHRDDFTPVNNNSLMRHKFDEIGYHMEKAMGHHFFCCDAVLDTYSRQIEIHSGTAAAVQESCWEMANKRTYVPFAEKKYNVMVFGLPQNFHYGNGMGTNPIMLMQAISAQVVRHKRVMADNCVIIASSKCDGFFNDMRWPYLRELYDIYQGNYMQTLPDLNRLGRYFATNEEYIRKYRFANAFHPFHGFSMISSAHIAEKNTAAIYIVGAQEPGYARGMGLKTRATFEDALEDAKKIVGDNPNILALPKTFKLSAVHLMMKDDEYPTTPDYKEFK